MTKKYDYINSTQGFHRDSVRAPNSGNDSASVKRGKQPSATNKYSTLAAAENDRPDLDQIMKDWA